MAGSNNSNSGFTGSFFFDRSATTVVNANKIKGTFDYAYGRYLAWDSFFKELSRVQTGIVNNNGMVDLNTGQTVDINSVGGALGLQIYMQALDSSREAADGLANLGLKNENKLWTLR